VWRFINNGLFHNKGGNMEDGMKELLDDYHVHLPISATTALNWMHRFGMCYQRTKQTYYTDNHDRPDVVTYRNGYVSEHAEMLLRMPVWRTLKKGELEEVNAERRSSHAKAAGATMSEGDAVPEIKGFDYKGPNGEELVEVLVDDVMDTADREVLYPALGGMRSVRFEEAAQRAKAACRRHTPETCKCGQLIFHLGQDESIYRANDGPSGRWYIRGEGKLLPKTPGVGVMVSLVVSELRGVGFKLSDAEFEQVNAWRAEHTKRPPLTSKDPGLVFLEYGTNKEGYWNYEKMEEFVIDIMDAFDTLYPDMQLVLEVDWSSGHAKKIPEGLYATSMNLLYGGKQDIVRATEIKSKEGYLGDGNVLRERPVGAHASARPTGPMRKVRAPLLCVGEGQLGIFGVGPEAQPPWYADDAPRHDRVVQKERLVKQPDGSRKRQLVDVKQEGWEGKAKGLKQYLYERGLWDDKLGTKEARERLRACKDFQEQMSQLESVLAARGHILLMSPKCHPEVAGCGVEYCFGRSKYVFRRRVNVGDQKVSGARDGTVMQQLKRNVALSLSSEYIDLARSRRFTRRARTYRRIYNGEFDSAFAIEHSKDGFARIEAAYKVAKSHRNIFDTHRAFVSAGLSSSGGSGL